MSQNFSQYLFLLHRIIFKARLALLNSRNLRHDRIGRDFGIGDFLRIVVRRIFKNQLLIGRRSHFESDRLVVVLALHRRVVSHFAFALDELDRFEMQRVICILDEITRTAIGAVVDFFPTF